MTEELFRELLDNLSIHTLSQTGDNYAYSQAVPDGAEIDDVIFVMLFMWPVIITKTSENEMIADNSKYQNYINFALIILLLIMCIIIFLIVILITRKIIRAIRVLNQFSIEMK